MSFIENWRDGLTRWFDRGKNNVQHASEISDEQKQQWADQRAQSFVNNYRNAHPSLKIKPGKLGEDSWGNDPFGTSPDSYNDIARGEARASRNKPNIYEFSYRVPKDADNMDNGEFEVRKGVVYTFGPKSSSVEEDGSPWGETFVYEATLDDGTTLSAKEFEEFLATNGSNAGMGKYPLKVSGTDGIPSGSTKNKTEFIDKYRNIAKDYVTNYSVGQNANKKRVYWDKQKRMWMAK